ncbi:MAG: DNA polymerase I [Myxococcales bacterium]|nr:DNA polymerase I [Myxococcales bacterium]
MVASLPPVGDPKVLYLLDLSGYVYRAYHGLRPLSNSKGEVTHAVMGVANMLMRLVREQRPKYLAVAMDSARDESFRNELYKDYKANRPEPPADLIPQVYRCREVVEAWAIPVLQRDGFEADDLIAAGVREAKKHGLVTVICSADKDLMQLVDDDVLQWDAMRNVVYGRNEVKEKWGVAPERVADLLALMGDTSDNVPGVAGVGEKTAAKLVTEHKDLEGVLAAAGSMKGKLKENLQKEAELARLSYRLVKLDGALVTVELDLDKLVYGGWDADRIRKLYTDLEFGRLLDQFESAEREAKLARGESPLTTAKPAAGDGDKAATGAAAGAPGPIRDASGKRYRAILTVKELDEAIARCREVGFIGLDTETTSIEPSRAELVGVSLAWSDDEAVYVPIGHRVIGDPPQIPRDVVIAKLGALLADKAVKKCGHHIKYDDIVLRRAGAPVDGYSFDSMIASYLIDPERHSHKLDEVALGELGYKMISYDTVTKKTRGSQLTFEQVDIASATQYAAEDADIARMLSNKLGPRLDENDLRALMDDVEIPLSLVLAKMEERGVLVDVPLLEKLGSEVRSQMSALEKELIKIAGKEFNVNSPRQLETILFDELKLRVIKRTKTSRSTDAEVLEELAEEHPLPAKIIEHRQLAKLEGTYLSALPLLVNPATGRIHTSYNQAVAATGRLSSNNPNLQNIPIRTEIGRRIREAFIAPPGWKLFAADYSQIELRVLAHLSKDPILVDAFTKGEDVHTRTAVEIFKVPASEITREQRTRAKTVNFAVIYGQGDSALARQLGISRDEASRFIDAYFRTFKGLTQYLDKIVEQARAGEGVRTILGRRRFLPTISSENKGLRAQAERMAKNTPIQGTSADIMKVAMIRIQKAMEDKKLAARMILTVHDELVFEAPEHELEELEPMVKSLMETVVPLEVPLVVECGRGRTWGEAH